MKHFVKLALLLFIFSSCLDENNLSFSDPQPKNKKNLITFKKKDLGNYISVNNGSRLEILDNGIILKEVKDSFFYSQNRIDSSKYLEIKDNYLYRNGEKSQIPIEWNNDKTLGVYHNRIVAFNAEENILRFHNKKYFLNYKYRKDYWRVEVLDFKNKNTLYWYKITSNEAVNSIINLEEKIDTGLKVVLITGELEEIILNSETLIDTTQFAHDISRQKLRKIMNSSALELIGKYVKIE